MMRFFSVAILSLVFGAVVKAQDMPLSQIIKDGETWKLSTAKIDFPKSNQASGQGWNFQLVEKTIGVENSAVQVAKKQVLTLGAPSAIVAWSDGGTVVIANAEDRYLWTYRVDKDGTLGAGDRYYPLFVRRGETKTTTTAMTIDGSARLYAATKEGIQAFDPTGRLCGVIHPPTSEPIRSMTFGGDNGDELFVLVGDKVYVRKMLASKFPPKVEPKITPKKK